ncbi:hypothetical protein M406DRAFT_258016 [Cryphonectria parasitica EP155]|uniref:protein-ribulosamine 3-kinase n=1 Tax=Cryphonectria parasitica (strain ATCC 38755 / EP155) TaxID=660469 RepID=A0A9P5CP40_CRYP1|nr:uncharacterized protein M406DRAFT_258016 [Cryphonectria parasitica EP155]KAF3766099.1 hypothetical protein M406DRAFT_258016 [Cryphonectria parasitica EP155]
MAEEQRARHLANPASAHLIQYIDDAVRDVLPAGTRPIGISESGNSHWVRTAKLDTVDKNGKKTPFFLKACYHVGKVYNSEKGKEASTAYEAMTVLYAAWPELVPKPLAWGAYKSEKEVYFLMCQFVEISGEVPRVSDFPALLARMHKKPGSKSPTGEFGFRTSTFEGRNPVEFPLTKTWEETLTRSLMTAFEAEELTQGPDPEMRKLRKSLFSKVIPRLIRPLEAKGRRLEPTLCHGNLWDNNVSSDKITGKPKVYNGTPVYAHNECKIRSRHHEYVFETHNWDLLTRDELAPWFVRRHHMTDEYVKEYIKHYEVASPAADFKDRGILYSL